MTKEDLQVYKAELISKYGPLEWDMGAPANESAKLFVIARGKVGKEFRDRNAAYRESTASARQASLDAAVMAGAGIAIPEIDLKDNDLQHYTPVERTIIKQYFKNIRQTYREIAIETNLSYQKVTKLLQSDSFNVFAIGILRKLLPLASYAAVYAQIRLGNDRLAVEVLRDTGHMKNETIEHVVHRIEDPKAYMVLNSMGDTLATESPSAFTPTAPTPTPSTPKLGQDNSINIPGK